MELNEEIKQARKQRGLSQKDLGVLIGVSQQAVGQYEKGEIQPSTNTLRRIREVLGIGAGQLPDSGDLQETMGFINLSASLGINSEPCIYQGQNGYAFWCPQDGAKYFVPSGSIYHIKNLASSNVWALIKAASVTQILDQEE